ncbi:MAG: hypothetical protein KC468_08695, partial [Myxococcales bacterium]|nr:hypothetical protein [Myxococcales bacterium]
SSDLNTQGHQVGTSREGSPAQARALRRRRAAARRCEQLEHVLHYARARGRQCARRSNRAWLISAVAAAGGTLMAVAELRRATMWQDVIDALEDARVDARIELRMAEDELRRAHG